MVRAAGSLLSASSGFLKARDLDPDQLFLHFEWYNPRIEMGLRAIEYEKRTFTNLYVNLLATFEEVFLQEQMEIMKSQAQAAAHKELLQSVKISFAQKLQKLQRGSEVQVNVPAPKYGVDPTGPEVEPKKPRVPKPPVRNSSVIVDNQDPNASHMQPIVSHRRPANQPRRDHSLGAPCGPNPLKVEVMSRSLEHQEPRVSRKESCRDFVEFMKRSKENSMIDYLKSKQRHSGLYQPRQLFNTEKYVTDEPKYEKLKFFLAASIEQAKIGSARSGEVDIFSTKGLGTTGMANLLTLNTGRSGKNNSSHEFTRDDVNKRLNFNSNKEDVLDSLRHGGGSSTNIPNSSTSRLKHIVSYREQSTNRSNYMCAGTGLHRFDTCNRSSSRVNMPMSQMSIFRPDTAQVPATSRPLGQSQVVPRLHGLHQLSHLVNSQHGPAALLTPTAQTGASDTKQQRTVSGRLGSHGPLLLNKPSAQERTNTNTQWSGSNPQLWRDPTLNRTTTAHHNNEDTRQQAPRRGSSETGVRVRTALPSSATLQDREFVKIEVGPLVKTPALVRKNFSINYPGECSKVTLEEPSVELSFGNQMMRQDRSVLMKKAGLRWPSARLETDKQLSQIVNVDHIAKLPKDLMRKLKKIVDSKKPKV